ncbi:hypothetical protein A6A04_00925 [Paramagnetospirillum marisnigri]|uniref:Uncharacterized protein n=1 Tax=Paramagnetospirillum marisnigri TaxID=1285242 RepID=A0A178MS05_9PROT|nr:hypothetical protein [Paramagnetospirillum marisnigri]OAN52289.1 hypothetical protein A6A04_00925 [Paramagnetospirillum marisnigri]
MNGSLFAIIGNAIAAARQMGLTCAEQQETARAVLLAHDTSLTPGIARVLVEQLYDSVTALSEPGLAV